MGKKQHQKDKLYLTCTEWSTIYGGKRPKWMTNSAASEFKRLPFDHCALSLQPFENPYCDKDGNIFELVALLPFLKKFKVNPITGLKLDPKDLIKLNFHKNSADGAYQCPVMFKNFTNNSHIVAIKTTGNVFSYEPIEELNIKTKNWKELLTDEPFTRADIITIQDPSNLSKFNLTNFHHLKKNLKIEDEELLRASREAGARVQSVALETKEVMDELGRTYKEPEKKNEGPKKVADHVNAAHYSTGAVAASFTSTSMPIFTEHEAEIREEDSVRHERVKAKDLKGYVRIMTSHGTLNCELHCNQTPKACENFILLCKRDYYNNTKFHRSIKHFMIQGGDPTGKGTGGESAWGTPFKNEIEMKLKHEGRGILSMANSGPDTNQSQFFITYRSCKQLDGKHTVFGRVVGGLDTLSAFERIETDNKDRPIEDIIFIEAHVFKDPFEEIDIEIAAERAKFIQDIEDAKALKLNKNEPKTDTFKLKVHREGVGKYIDPKINNPNSKRKEKDLDEEGPSTSKLIHPPAGPPEKKKPKGNYNFNFSNWYN